MLKILWIGPDKLLTVQNEEIVVMVFLAQILGFSGRQTRRPSRDGHPKPTALSSRLPSRYSYTALSSTLPNRYSSPVVHQHALGCRTMFRTVQHCTHMTERGHFGRWFSPHRSIVPCSHQPAIDSKHSVRRRTLGVLGCTVQYPMFHEHTGKKADTATVVGACLPKREL